MVLLLPSLFLKNLDSNITEAEVIQQFKTMAYSQEFTPEFDTIHVMDRSIYYMCIGDTTKPLVFFVHGAPGSYDNFMGFLKDSTLLQHARMLSVDRPGYGNSGKKESETSIEKQAKMLLEILKANDKGRGVVLVGHSYGGPIIARMAMEVADNEPDLIDALVLAAPAIDPEHEKIFFVSRKVPWAIVKWITPRFLKRANDEKMTHVEELKKMLPLWEKITIPVTYIHGEKDGLVPFENTAFAKRVLVNAPVDYVTKEKMGHLIPWKNPELMKDAILKHLSQIDSVQHISLSGK
ncbi:alpha/beta fold hydrolase [Chondrinema litorale]|uniref:alpha/beta fold hydrolase n=1 Tax=Chondrinema litorale TaxID=2994555 RepID=UPI0025436E9F|nr:alpha/beta hydrolase [Chondrinema litorale]UZR93862.1 alpha/beta hydrolase [Chondrinema litorale]